MSDKYDPAMPPPPDSIEVFTPEGNLTLMTELVAQAKESERKIEEEKLAVQKWTQRVELSKTQPDPSLLEDAKLELKKHKRALLKAQMDLATFKDKKAALKFQHKAPSAEQKFRTAQAQNLVNQFQEMGIDPDGAKMDKQFKLAAAEQELSALKEKAGVQKSHAQITSKTASANQTQKNSQENLTPGDLRRGAALGKTLCIKEKIYQRIDAVNVGTITDETAHKLTREEELERVKLESSFPNGRTLSDEGIRFEKKISFTFTGLTPGKNVLLLFRVDVGETYNVLTAVNENPVQTRDLEVDASYRWCHETVLVPAGHITNEKIIVSRTPKDGTKSNLYGVWCYQIQDKAKSTQSTSQVSRIERAATVETQAPEKLSSIETAPTVAAPLVSSGKNRENTMETVSKEPKTEPNTQEQDPIEPGDTRKIRPVTLNKPEHEPEKKDTENN